MYRIGKRFSFDAAHLLHGLPEGHRCGRLHGHTYTVEIELTSEDLAPPGFVTDFADLAPLKWLLDERLDHRCLNEVLDFEPTSELLARQLFAWCARHLQPQVRGTIAAVRVCESPSTWAEYRPSQP